MRIARKLFLLCAMALTALALSAGAASAQETAVEVTGEETGHCNPCSVTAVGTQATVLQQHILGSESTRSICQDTFVASIGEDGAGAIHDQTFTGGGCTEQPCDTASEGEWPITDTGETGTDVGHMWVNFCLEPIGGGTEHHCDVEIQVGEELAADHHERFSVSDWRCTIIPGIAFVEVTGAWETTGESENIEITHL